MRALHPNKVDDYLLHRMDKANNSAALIRAQLHVWGRMGPEQRHKLNTAKKSGLLENALEQDALSDAENIFNDIRSSTDDRITVAVLARRIVSHCEASKNESTRSKYQNLVAELTKPTIALSLIHI